MEWRGSSWVQSYRPISEDFGVERDDRMTLAGRTAGLSAIPTIKYILTTMSGMALLRTTLACDVDFGISREWAVSFLNSAPRVPSSLCALDRQSLQLLLVRITTYGVCDLRYHAHSKVHPMYE